MHLLVLHKLHEGMGLQFKPSCVILLHFLSDCVPVLARASESTDGGCRGVITKADVEVEVGFDGEVSGAEDVLANVVETVLDVRVRTAEEGDLLVDFEETVHFVVH